MNGCKLVAIGEIKNEKKGKDIAHGGTPPFGNRLVAYMKKELHRHHENVSTALEILYGIVRTKTVASWPPIHLLGVDIGTEKTTVFDKAEFTFWRMKTKAI